jgi:transcription termination factor Rho
LNPSKYDFDSLYHKAENFRTNQKHIYITPPSFMKFCPVVREICRGQVHVPKKERRIKRIIIIRRRNGAKTISLPN